MGRRWQLGLYLASIFALVFLWFGSGVPAHAQGRAPGGNLRNPVVRGVDIAAPAVARVATLYSGHITLAFCGQTMILPQTGSYTEGAFGSGAFINGQGDLLTADHVVHVDHATLERQLLQDPAAQADIVTALNNSPCYGFGQAITPGDIANGFLQTSGVVYTMTFDAPRTLVWRDAAYTGPLSTKPQDGVDTLTGLEMAPHEQATILASSDFSHDDLAVLHVNLSDTPSIALDDSASVQPLDTLTILGFPANGDANFVPTNLVTPSYNQVTVSAVKSDVDGGQLIQVGGNIEHGDSGGPALDANGRIVGVVSFGGEDTQGMTAFLRSSDAALRLIAAAKVNSRAGAFERAWERSFADYAAQYPGHWRKASEELQALVKAYPTYRGALPYLAYAQEAARKEQVPGPSAGPPPWLVALLVGIAALALTLVGGTLALVGRPRTMAAARRLAPLYGRARDRWVAFRAVLGAVAVGRR